MHTTSPMLMVDSDLLLRFSKGYLMPRTRTTTTAMFVFALTSLSATGCSAPEQANSEFLQTLSGGESSHVDYEPLKSPTDALERATDIFTGTAVSVGPGVVFQSEGSTEDETEVRYVTVNVEVGTSIEGGTETGEGTIVPVQMMAGPISPQGVAIPEGEMLVIAVSEPVTPDMDLTTTEGATAGGNLLFAFYDGVWLEGPEARAISLDASSEEFSTHWGGQPVTVAGMRESLLQASTGTP